MARATQKTIDMLNEIAMTLGVFGRQPSMRYFSLPKDPQRFCWTTEKTSDSTYWALLYRIRKDGTWILKKKRGFKHRASAKRCARKWKENTKNDA